MKRSWTLLVILVTMVVGGIPAQAGGWAITSFDELPGEIQAGTTYEIGYTILQHGSVPFEGADSSISIWNQAGGDALTFPGRADGVPGHYVAEVTFPEAGEWSWSVHQDWFGERELGQLMISKAPTASVSAAGLPGVGVVLAAATVLALGAFIAQALMMLRRRTGRVVPAD